MGEATGRAGRHSAYQKDLDVLLITLDTVRYDRISIHSDEFAKTPNIDALAGESIVFERAFSHNPVTLPAHTNILTGTTPLFHGISDNAGFRLDGRFLTLAEHLRGSGYATGAFIGAFPLDSRFGLDQGFDVYDDNYGTHSALNMFFAERPAVKVIAPAVKWISEQQGKWFAWVHLFDPHQPYRPPAPYDRDYMDDPYSGEIAYVDASLGKLFDFLRNDDIWNRTIIILTADHGEALGEKGEETHAYFAYNNTIHIPLIIRIPGTAPAVVTSNVCHADIFPTVCEIVGMKTPAHVQGESLVALAKGSERKNKEIYFESLTAYLNRGWAPLRGFIGESIKYIDLPVEEVYDLSADMDENNNLAESTDTSGLAKELEALIEKLTEGRRAQRSDRLDDGVRRKLESLGYATGISLPRETAFTAGEDLKTLLPLQNRMITALGMYQNGNVGKAIAELEGVINESPGFLYVYIRLATILKEYGRIEQAVEVLEDGVRENPGDTKLESHLGIMLAEAGNPDEAIRLLTECARKASFNAEIFNYLGVAYYRSGQFDRALENYDRALRLDSNYASVFNNIGSLNLLRYLKTGDESAYDLALENFAMAIEIDPRLAAAFNGRGAAHKFGNDNPRAIADWKKALEIKPDFIDPYFSIGITLLEDGKKDRALEYLLPLRERYESRLAQKERERLSRLIDEASR